MPIHMHKRHLTGLAMALTSVLALSANQDPRPPDPKPQDPKAQNPTRPREPEQARPRESSATRGMRAMVDEILAGWTKEARDPAEAILTKYGEPAEVTDNMLIWHRKAPWKHIVVYREPLQHDFPAPHKDLVEMFIDARVPADKFDELAQFDGSITCYRTKGEISSRCDSEEMNFATLNLAQDIVNGQKTVEEARRVLAHTAKAFKAGEKDPLTQGLRNQPTSGTFADPDQPAGAADEPEGKPKPPTKEPNPKEPNPK